jgi:hypothetical protein
MTRDELLVEYHDRSLSELRLELERRLRRCLPGWYDTHATF